MAVMTSDDAKEGLKPKLNENIFPKFQYKNTRAHSFIFSRKKNEVSQISAIRKNKHLYTVPKYSSLFQVYASKSRASYFISLREKLFLGAFENCKMPLLPSSCLSVRPHGTIQQTNGRIFIKFDIREFLQNLS